MTSLINLAFDENGQKAAKIDLNALINEDYRQVKPKPKSKPVSHQPKARFDKCHCLKINHILGDTVKGEKVDRQTARTRGLNVKVPRPPKKKEPVNSMPVKEKPNPKSRTNIPVNNPIKQNKPERNNRQYNNGSKENITSSKQKNSTQHQNGSKDSMKQTGNSDQVITLTQDQLTKLLGMVVNSSENVSIPATSNLITANPNPNDHLPSDNLTIESAQNPISDDIEPVNALKILQNQNVSADNLEKTNDNPLANSTLNVPKEQNRKLSRDEQLAESQKNIPLQMRSSFLPYEAVPRDILAEQRKQKQMEWRRELEKQRRDDEERKKAQKDKEKKEMLPDHHLFQSVTDLSQLEEAERPTDIPKLDLVRELSTVSARPDSKPNVNQNQSENSTDFNNGFHRRLNTLKDPEELRRLDEARQARFKHEQLIRDQIEEKKRIEAKNRDDDEEPWWVRQDKRKQMALDKERKQTNVIDQQVQQQQFQQQQVQQQQQPIVPKIDVSQPDEPLLVDEGYRDTTSSRQPLNSQGRIILREIETQTDPITTKSPPKSTRDTIKPVTSTTSLSAKSVASTEYKTNLELRALEREEKRKRRQIELLEEQQRQEERLIQLRASKSKIKQEKKPLSREKVGHIVKTKSKTDVTTTVTTTTTDNLQVSSSVLSENNSNQAVLNQLQQLRSRLQQKHDAFKKK